MLTIDMNILLQNKKNKNVHYKKQTNTTKLNINQLSEGKIEFQPLKNKNNSISFILKPLS